MNSGYSGNRSDVLEAKAKVTVETARRLISECVLFRGLSSDQRSMLVRSAHLRSLGAGDTIFLTGDPGDSMMAVLTGTVRMSAPSPDGKELILSLMQPGEFFGELALLDGNERSADAKAMTDCTLAILNRRDACSSSTGIPSVGPVWSKSYANGSAAPRCRSAR